MSDGRKKGSDEAKGLEPESYPVLAGGAVTARPAVLGEGRPRAPHLTPASTGRAQEGRGWVRGGDESGPCERSAGIRCRVERCSSWYCRPPCGPAPHS